MLLHKTFTLNTCAGLYVINDTNNPSPPLDILWSVGYYKTLYPQGRVWIFAKVVFCAMMDVGLAQQLPGIFSGQAS